MRKKRLAGLLAAGILALLLNGCGETGAVPADMTENEEVTVDLEEKPETTEETTDLKAESETAQEMAGAEAVTEEPEEPEQDPIVGTWKTRTRPDIFYSKLEEWQQT